MSIFHLHEVVSRGSDTQLHVGEKFKLFNLELRVKNNSKVIVNKMFLALQQGDHFYKMSRYPMVLLTFP